MSRPTNEMLMAYADGELEGEERALVEAAIAADPEVAGAVAQHRALRARLSGAFDDVLAEPVPARLVALLEAPVAPAAPVVDLASRRAPRRFGPPALLAMAASLVVGVFVGLFAPRGPEAPFDASGGALLARGALAEALDGRLAAEGVVSGVRIGLSFRDRSGTYCRTFSVEDRTALAGLACSQGAGWQVEVLAAGEAAGELRAASALPPAVLAAVESKMAGEPLGAAAEAAARESGWR